MQNFVYIATLLSIFIVSRSSPMFTWGFHGENSKEVKNMGCCLIMNCAPPPHLRSHLTSNPRWEKRGFLKKLLGNMDSLCKLCKRGLGSFLLCSWQTDTESNVCRSLPIFILRKLRPCPQLRITPENYAWLLILLRTLEIGYMLRSMKERKKLNL